MSFLSGVSETRHYPAEDQSIMLSLTAHSWNVFGVSSLFVGCFLTGDIRLLPKLLAMFLEMSKGVFWIHLKHVRVVCIPQPSLCHVLLSCWEENPCQNCAYDSFGLLQNAPMARCSWCSAWPTTAQPPPLTWSFVQRN